MVRHRQWWCRLIYMYMYSKHDNTIVFCNEMHAILDVRGKKLEHFFLSRGEILLTQRL